MFRLVILSLIAAAGGTLCAYDDVKNAMAAGRTLQQAHKYTEAAAAYREAAELAGNNLQQKCNAIFAEAAVKRIQKKADDAIALYLRVADNAEYTRTQRTQAYMNAGRNAVSPAKKREYLEKGAALKSGNWTEAACITALGEREAEEKKFDEAVKRFQFVAENQKFHEISRQKAYLAMAGVRITENKFAEAHAIYAKLRAFSKQYKRSSIAAEGDFAEAVLYKKEAENRKAAELFAKTAACKTSSGIRIKALEELVDLKFNRMNDPKGALDALELFKKYNLRKSRLAEKLEKEIRIILGLDE